MQELLQLPWQFQIVVISGYLGYRVAYSGRTSAHKTTDVLAIILCFGGIALFAFELVKQHDDSLYYGTLGSVAAVLIALMSAALWRRFFRSLSIKAIRWLSQSQDDGHATAWETIIQHQGLDYSQLNVTLNSDYIYESYPLGKFNKLPNGPCVLGGDGSIALFVTHITDPSGKRREANLLETSEGARMTYIPIGSIREVDFRRIRRGE